MRLTFIGADHEVTGSCHFLEACGKKMIIDYGMEQGHDLYENQDIPVSASEIDYVLLTHAHIDHSGLLPLLYAKGFRGSIFATHATRDLCDIMLRDSAHIQMFEAEWRNRKARRSGNEEYVPVYTMEDADGVLKLFKGCPYNEITKISDQITIRFIDVGHLLGSASIEVWALEGGEKRKIVFSGDIGNLNQPIIKDPAYIEDADYVVMESTYGDRSHGAVPDYVAEFVRIIKSTFDKGGNLVIPSFAVGRTQEILYFLRKIKADRLIKGHENFEVYVDSPLAVSATTIFNQNETECFDEETMDLIRQGINPISFPGLKLSITSDESRAINFDDAPKVIISASGMCEAGRIRHHLKHNLWRKECTILFVGYQAAGTLGRSILEGAAEVRLFGETIEIQARIEKLSGVSGHADREGLLKWAGAFNPKPSHVFVVHGDDEVCDTFAKTLREDFGLESDAPFSGAVFNLLTNVYESPGVRILKENGRPAKRRKLEIFDRLVDAGKRLMTVIYRNEGTANKDLGRFISQIQALCDKWDKS